MTLTRQLLAASAAIALVASVSTASAQELTIESWRVEDAGIWQDKIIPAFEAANPGIKVTFAPTAAAEYDAALGGRLEGGTAGDLIACRPFDVSLKLFDGGYLAPLNDLPGMENFSPMAKVAWSTDDQATSFCVPMGAAILGFIYNKEVFDELGLSAPQTVAEFHQVLEKLAAESRYLPLAMGTNDLWEAATVGYQNIGPTYWKGEEGRLALIAGTQKLSDENWVAPYRELASWRRYLGGGFEAQTYSDSQNLFTLGRAAIYPAGSWEIPGFNANAPFAMGAFPPPVVNAGDPCYVTERPEIGIGLNAKSPSLGAARAFLSFVASQQFGEIEANALPGLYPLSSEAVMIEDPLAQEFASWRDRCETTIPSTAGLLSRGTPSLEEDTRKAVMQVIKGAETPESVAARLQAGLDRWYKPAE
jgi:raffinose/stachyose/melibiose transport system substrate-binding protein